MDIPNLAAVFCPGILRHPDHNSPIQYKISQYVIEFLIEFQSLFTMQLLVPTKRTNTAGSDVPPVPLLLASSTVNRISFSSSSSSSPTSPTTSLSPPPPPVPLHIVNPSLNTSSSILSSLNSFIQSPQDIINNNKTDQQQSRSINQEDQLGDKFIHLATPYYHLLRKKFTEFRRFVEPYIVALLACISVLLVTLCVIVYEVYLAVALVSFEPLVFFTGFASYWGILGHTILSMPIKEDTLAVREIHAAEETAVVEEEEDEEEVEEEEEEELYTGIDEETEKAMLKDETIMSEWRDLLTRAWKTNEEGPTSSAASIFAAADTDISSVMSRSSRFDEEENFAVPLEEENSSSDDDEADLGFDPETLEAFLSQYDQIKKDAQLAKQLQIEEQKARDENNPFLADVLVNQQKTTTPLKIDSAAEIASFDDDQVVTPTEKEAWKIRIFRD
ncbi:hypothetical protein BD770DRAFT_64155 [Pilaira anomala]|nr:hypothetical protein BD770DRAFT_64155 [Pilaira anomala]